MTRLVQLGQVWLDASLPLVAVPHTVTAPEGDRVVGARVSWGTASWVDVPVSAERVGEIVNAERERAAKTSWRDALHLFGPAGTRIAIDE